jgi:sterol desaturase/sphingolipid hydroxylase (fatty acid hydroxylase superfamily)
MHLVAAAIAALLSWSLFEYSLHRFVFHWAPKSEWGRRFVFIMHGNHHEDPQDPTRLVMPPAGGILIATPLFFLFRAVLGIELGEWFFAAFIVGYLCYDYTHFSVHFFRPRTGLGRWIKRYHMHHHFSTPDARWGVSSPLWDYVFGTAGQNSPAREVSNNISSNDARISSS